MKAAMFVMAILMASSTANAYQGNFFLKKQIEAEAAAQAVTSPEWVAPEAGEVDSWELAAYPWLDFFPRLRDSATVTEPVIQVAGGNIWTGGCKVLGFDRFIQFLRGNMYGNNLA